MRTSQRKSIISLGQKHDLSAACAYFPIDTECPLLALSGHRDDVPCSENLVRRGFEFQPIKFPVLMRSPLFRENNSLFCCVGNFRQKPCGGAINCRLYRSQSRDFAKFPVKFPVSRENGQSRGPSALLRQPPSPGSRDFPYNVAMKPAVSGPLASGREVSAFQI